MANSSKIAVVNISSNQYLPNQMLFAKQLHKSNPDLDLYCITLENKQVKSQLFKTIRLKDITSLDWQRFVFQYDVLELATAVKPYVIRWLMNKYGYNKVLYFDSDILVYSSLSLIIEKLNKHDVVLTPHIRKIIRDDKLPAEIDFSKSGYFNLGFIAFAQNQHSLEFLDWWSDQMTDKCIIDFSQFYFVDQRWIDYAPIFLNSYIIKEPGYNVSYFNLQEYVSKYDPQKIIFFHFSGFDINYISRHQNRFNPNNLDTYWPLFNDYFDRLLSIKPKKASKYIYSQFDNQVNINNHIRKFLLNKQVIADLTAQAVDLSNPFDSTINNSLFRILLSPKHSSAVINIIYYFYISSTQIRSNFPDLDFNTLNKKLLTFIDHFITSATTLYHFDSIFVRRQKKLLKSLDLSLKAYTYRTSAKINRLRLSLLFLSIMKLTRATDFINNLYYFFLNRFPEANMLSKYASSTQIKMTTKKDLVKTILTSTEYNQIKHSSLTKFGYKFLLHLI